MENIMQAFKNKDARGTVEDTREPGQRMRSVSCASPSSSDSSLSPDKPWTNGTDKKKPTTLPNETVEYLKAWMMSPEHIEHPYPTEVEKAKIMEDTGLELKQLTNWFVNNRKRYWKPRVEARLKDQGKASVSPTRIKRVEKMISFDNSDENTCTTREYGPRDSKRRPPTARTTSANERNSTRKSPLRFVSGHNSVASVSDCTNSSDDDEEERRAFPMEVQVEETLDLYILRPSTGLLPEISDVTVLQNIPTERILRVFDSCALTYRYTDIKKAHSRRDAEIVRMKKHYLSLYLNEVVPCAEDAVTVAQTPAKKRKETVHVIPMTPRPKYRRVSVDLWKEACQTANHVYDHELPSLEEATRLFGYSA